MKLETYEDNGGCYHWRLVNPDGTSIATSTKLFESREDARQAAQLVHDDAAAITIEAA